MTEEVKNKEQKKPKFEKVDRIALSKKSTQIIEMTIDLMEKNHSGIKMNKKDFVNWLIEESFAKLSPSDEKRLFERFYDEIKHIERSLKELKKKKQNGEDISIEKLLRLAKPSFKKDVIKDKETSKPKGPDKSLNVTFSEQRDG